MNAIHRIYVLIGGGVVVLGAALVGLQVLRGGLPLRSARTQLSAAGKLEIVRHPEAAVVFRQRGTLERLPIYNPTSGKNWQIDLRGRDVSALELSGRASDLRHADFDSGTRWPARLPADFDPKAAMELNKSPGLGVRALHARGITGEGVGIGIIDQALLVEHVEYRERLRSYEEIHLYDTNAQMHGPAVASIAVGKTVGVAPGADLYYVAETHGERVDGKFEMDFTWLAKAMHRLLDINEMLPPGRKIRVISASIGWSAGQKGYAEATAAVERATKAGVFVVSSGLQRTHGLAFHGLGRDPRSDPERAESYGPGSWWAPSFWKQGRFGPGERLLVPMDARAVASPTGAADYVYYADGGWSWSIPWIAGLYALACQVQPEVTPKVFWEEALRTGKTIRLQHEGKSVEFGTIADPEALMKRLKG